MSPEEEREALKILGCMEARLNRNEAGLRGLGGLTGKMEKQIEAIESPKRRDVHR